MKKCVLIISVALFLSLIALPSYSIQPTQTKRQRIVSPEVRMILQKIASLKKKRAGIELSIKVLQKSIGDLNTTIAEKEKNKTRLIVLSTKVKFNFEAFKRAAEDEIKLLISRGDMAGIAKVKASLAKREAQTIKHLSNISSDISKVDRELDADKKRLKNLKNQLKLKQTELQKVKKEIRNLELKLKSFRLKK
ncbi:MAG: hypothetical protein ABFR75_10305 [Acidobacteriota bacterium]